MNIPSMSRLTIRLISTLMLGLWVHAPSLAETTVTEVAQREFFENQVRPLLTTECFKCHSAQAEKLKAGLRLDSREGLLAGGDSGPAIVPGQPADSLLMSAVRYDSFEMPPRGKLGDSQIATLQRWIQQGAWWPPEDKDKIAAEQAHAVDWNARKEGHWAWQPLATFRPPSATDGEAGRSPIDRFIVARMRAADLQPAPPAPSNHLVRRLYFDLIGLPPTPEQVQAFVSQPSPRAYAQLVDGLLASPHFGEKWTRHWLDLVRYAETCGHEFDYPIPHAYRYRDYVIRALNADVPYDQLVREHIAGDLLSPPRREPRSGANESIVGTGFWFLGEAVHAPTDVRGDEADRINNQIDVFGKAFLAMTLACARCHDHKFDPIPTTDYYALAGFLQSSRRQEALLDPHEAIAQQTDQIATRRREGDRLLSSVFSATDRPAIDRFADFLMAAQNRVIDQLDSEPSALNGALDPQLLDRFVAALQDPALRSVDHPLFTWHELTRASGNETFIDRRVELNARLQQQQQSYQTALTELFPFAEFRDQDYRDWFVTGWAFGQQPTAQVQWDGPAILPQFTRPAVAHSGRFGRRLAGVLRSQTFTLRASVHSLSHAG